MGPQLRQLEVKLFEDEELSDFCLSGGRIAAGRGIKTENF
jgi:hypothetical protein